MQTVKKGTVKNFQFATKSVPKFLSNPYSDIFSKHSYVIFNKESNNFNGEIITSK